MNQILDSVKNRKKLINILKIQIFFSVLGIVAVFGFFNARNNSSSSENYSKELFVNQKLSTIYQTEKLEDESDIFGSIEIPKIGIIYPVFNKFSEELLDLSPCKFNGPNINENR